jgi:hypothetical protein
VNGRAVCTVTGDQGRAGITSDGLHGALIAWSDARTVGTAHIFAHHVLASGSLDPVWPVGGRGIAGTNVLESRPIAVPDGVGGAIVCWQGFTVRLNVFAQHVKSTGVVGPRVARRRESPEHVQADSGFRRDRHGRIRWSRDRLAGRHSNRDSARVRVERVRSRGFRYRPRPGRFTQPERRSHARRDRWKWGDRSLDGHAQRDTDIYAIQVLNVVATSVGDGAGAGFALAHPGPNPARVSVGLRFTTPREAAVRLSIFDPQGRLVRVLESGARPGGQHATSWDLRDQSGRPVGAGLYFAKLEVGGRSLVEKVVTLR